MRKWWENEYVCIDFIKVANMLIDIRNMWKQQTKQKIHEVFSTFPCETEWWSEHTEWTSLQSWQILIWGRKQWSRFSHGGLEQWKDSQCRADEELNKQICKGLKSKAKGHFTNSRWGHVIGNQVRMDDGTLAWLTDGATSLSLWT